MFNNYDELITIEDLCSMLSIGKNAATGSIALYLLDFPLYNLRIMRYNKPH